MVLRPSILAFRVSPDERQLLLHAARLAGETVSQLARRAALRAARSQVILPRRAAEPVASEGGDR
jgi:uncharacterized protein (DUF1778 family)